ncbi:MAG: protein kinase [Polyangiaceae bacterium]|nr:protein kinase [Polyangiaceae bacterium]
MSSPAAQPPAEPETGDTVLGVTILAKIGSGNAGAVWTGLDGEAAVAVKLFDPSPGGEAARAAFVRGVRAMERLAALGDARPPSILRLIRASEDGLQMVTDLAESSAVDLSALQWPPRETVRFFEGICRAIEAAHRVGVVHRGLKPSNILVTGDLTPLVGDFDMVDLPSLAREAGAGGYAPYAAPEELSGEGTGGEAADIYGLGRLLWFLLTGADPDEPAEDMPALRSLSEQPRGLVRIIRKCTMRYPSARYRSVGELLAHLERYERADEVGLAGADDMDAGPLSSRSPAPASVRRPMPSSPGLDGPPSARRPMPSSPGLDGPPSARRPIPSSPGLDGPPSTRRPIPSSPGLDGPPSTRRPIPSSPGAEAAPASRRSLASMTVNEARAPGLPRRAELAAAAAGAGAIGVSCTALALVALPPEGLAHAAQVGVAAGAALLTLALPRFPHRLAMARATMAIAAAVLVYLADASRLAVFRLRATAATGDAASRAEAVKRLIRGGHRRFDGKDLSGLSLAGADLSSASFRGALLAGADLSSSALMESAFDGADLTGAIVKGANFTSTDADGARGWESVECDEETRFPGGWACVEGHPGRAGEAAAGPGGDGP